MSTERKEMVVHVYLSPFEWTEEKKNSLLEVIRKFRPSVDEYDIVSVRFPQSGWFTVRLDEVRLTELARIFVRGILDVAAHAGSVLAAVVVPGDPTLAFCLVAAFQEQGISVYAPVYGEEGFSRFREYPVLREP